MDLYFPKHIYEKAHAAFLKQSDVNIAETAKFCMEHQDFFVEVAFAYVEERPFPLMSDYC